MQQDRASSRRSKQTAGGSTSHIQKASGTYQDMPVNVKVLSQKAIRLERKDLIELKWVNIRSYKNKQESCAIAKMTARCALCNSA